MAWGPPYQPQLGHTTWGSLACRHCGQMLRAGAFSVQLLARRLRLFAFDVFFLGTAIGGRSPSGSLVGAQRVERGPPVVFRWFAVARIHVPVGSARRAQPPAVA